PNRWFRNVPQGLQVSNKPFIRQGYCGSSVHKHVAPHSPYGAFHNRGLDLRGPYDDDSPPHFQHRLSPLLYAPHLCISMALRVS
ncbi:hypothetical protein T06_9857, partial [Trichinella sp. T6]